MATQSKPLLFEAALSQRGKCFSLDAEGEATLTLQVPEQFAQVLSDHIHRLRNFSFVVHIEGLSHCAHAVFHGFRHSE